MKVLTKMVFGSHLYGLDTPSSDLDYKGIFLPEHKDILLQKVPKSINKSTGNNNEKNTSDDVDEEMFSLHYFVELALKGETVALDMLHCTSPLVNSHEWEFLVKNRHMFYTKNLKAFMGYLKRQVAKYSVRGSRLADIKKAIEAIEKEIFSKDYNGLDIRLGDIWEKLPEGEYLKKIQEKRLDGNKFYEVNAKRYQGTVKAKEVLDLLNKMYNSYGSRAKLAEQNDSIDWKAVSHAFRAGYQLRSIYKYGDFSYPLLENEYIRKVKSGKLDFKTEVQEKLESLMDEVQELADKSTLPNNSNREFWENWLIDVYNERYNLK